MASFWMVLFCFFFVKKIQEGERVGDKQGRWRKERKEGRRRNRKEGEGKGRREVRGGGAEEESKLWYTFCVAWQPCKALFSHLT